MTPFDDKKKNIHLNVNEKNFHMAGKIPIPITVLKACLHGGGGPQVPNQSGLHHLLTRLSIQSLILIQSRLHDSWGDPLHVTSPI